jgi:hypothetical protein
MKTNIESKNKIKQQWKNLFKNISKGNYSSERFKNWSNNNK